MTDAIISELSRATSLKVISRTSVMRYKGTNKPVSEIARDLSVKGVIEGSVLREGNRVRINAQLIHAPTEKQLWADSFERDERNVISLQGEIAHTIMRQLQVRLAREVGSIQLRGIDPEAVLKAFHAFEPESIVVNGPGKDIEFESAFHNSMSGPRASFSMSFRVLLQGDVRAIAAASDNRTLEMQLAL